MTGLASVLALGLVLASSPRATDALLERAIVQVRALEERAALKALEQVRHRRGITPEVLARAHLWTGLAYAGLNDGARAKASFRLALVLEPALLLPEGFSPRVQSWWADAGGRVPLLPTPPAAPPVVLRPLAPTAARPSLVPIPPPELRLWVAPPRHWHRWAGVGVGVAGLGCGVAGGLLSMPVSTFNERSRTEDDVGRSVRLHELARHSAQTANVLFGVGGGLLVGAGLLVLLGR